MVLQVIIEPFNLFSATGWGIDFDYCDTEWFALETNRDHSVLKLQLSTAFWTLVNRKGYLVTSKGFLPTVVDIMVR